MGKHPPRLHLCAKDFPIDGVVVDDKHPALCESGLHRTEVNIFIIRHDIGEDGKTECAAASRDALDVDPAAHQLTQSARDCEAETGSAVFAGGRAVRLRE